MGQKCDAGRVAFTVLSTLSLVLLVAGVAMAKSATVTTVAPGVNLGSVSAPPGGHVSVNATLNAAGLSAGVAGAQNDISYDRTTIAVQARCNDNPGTPCTSDADCGPGDTCADEPDCHVNPAIGKGSTMFSFQPSGCAVGACTGVRALVFSLGSNSNHAIADGATLYSCNLAIAPAATPGTYPLVVTNVTLSYEIPPGGAVPGTAGTNGAVMVAAPTPTSTPTPRFTETSTPTPTFTETSTPTPTPTSTATPTPTATPTATTTSTPTATVAPVSILVGSASGMPGQQVSFAVTLDAAGQLVGGTQNDIAFDSASAPIGATAEGVPDCKVNANINKPSTMFGFLPHGCVGTECTGLRAMVFAISNADPIPDGSTLYTCKVNISPNASPASYPLTVSGVHAGDPSGNAMVAAGAGGEIAVGSPEAAIIIGSASGRPNGAVQVEVSLHAVGEAVAGVQVDIDFDPTTPIGATGAGEPACAVNPGIRKNATTFAFQPAGCTPGSNCDRARALVFAIDNASPIADGATLFTCTVNISPTAKPGTYALIGIGERGSDPRGNPLALACVGGSIIVGPVCLGDCNGNGQVTVDELVTGVSIALGEAPIENCAALDANGDRLATIDELVQALNNALDSCPPP